MTYNKMIFMLKESRGQISAEWVLLVGLFLVLVMGVAVYYGQSNEVTVALAAAKGGFIDAANNIAYNGSGNTIRINSMSFNNGVITVKYYSTTPLNSSSILTIQKTMLSDIASAVGYPYTAGSGSDPGYVQTNRYKYTVTLQAT